MDSIGETLLRRKLNPADKLIDILTQVEDDEESLSSLLEDSPEIRGEMLLKSRTLKHKLLKDLIVAKQTEDDQLLKLQQLEKDTKAHEGAKIPILQQHDLVRLPDGRIIVNVKKEATETKGQ